MARKMKSFKEQFENASFVAENERILNSAAYAPTADEPTNIPTPSAIPAAAPALAIEQISAVQSAQGAKAKKKENGITINVPMEYYERIALMKMRTGIPIRDLALQAVIEFINAHKDE